jgi:ribosomal-protein-alanine N-acetyltransferase
MAALAEIPICRYRPMRGRDVLDVLAIEQEAYEFPWTEGTFRDCMSAGYSCWVMDRDYKIASYGVMSVALDEAHILNLCVKPEFHGRALGYAMLLHLIDTARHHRVESIFLEVRPSNPTAIELYRRTGFAEVGTRKDYYPAHIGREDAVIMALNLRVPKAHA